MSKRNWTDEQESAIYTSNSKNDKKCNILVSAAAGSGKTAVLVERIIKKILPDDLSSSIDINKLLVVTFTNAAAKEMKDRISSALSSELKTAAAEANEEKVSCIKRQLLLLHTADITTIDAFCMKTVRENFSILGLDPDFSIADEGQALILADEAIEELFTRLYDERNEDFYSLMDLYSTSSSHKRLSELVKYIYSYTRSIPFPLEWLTKKTEELQYNTVSFSDSRLYKATQNRIKNKLEEAMHQTKKALYEICETTNLDEYLSENLPEKNVEVYDIWGSVYKAFYQDYFLLKELMTVPNPYDIVKNHTFSVLSFNKRVCEEQKNRFKFIRENTKASVKSLSDELCFSCEKAEEISRNTIYPAAKSLCRLVSEFHEAFMAKKSGMNLLEFHDVEQLTAELFKNNQHIRESFKNKYEEILMDEYQDTSLLQEEIFSQIKKDDNLFMVGDIKQSIYRFRSSDPSIFKSKITSFSQDKDSNNKKIILSNNFRSRGCVLSSINDVFEEIMTESGAEIDYDESQRLNQLVESYADLGQDHKSVFAEIANEVADDTESIEKIRLEARYAASEINRLKSENFKVRDGDTYRTIKNSDFAILLSKYKNVAEIIANELNDAGIECHAESTGYFDQSEIQLMMSLLKIIINPYDDIPLIAVLRSPIASFTDDEIAIIRKCKKGKFYSALKEITVLDKNNKLSSAEESKTAKKAEEFINTLTKWRSYSRYMSTDKLVWTLYEESDFYAFSGAMYDGETVQANLRLLFLRAKQYEDNGFRGLFNFIKYLENLKQRDSDLTSARLLSGSHDMVRIMTIHKSKGLEMPVVFILGTGNPFRTKTESSHIVLHKAYGIGLDLIKPEQRYKTETLEKRMIKSVLHAEDIAEEMRKLYVAMTRAKEKLYVVSSHSYDELNASCEYEKKMLLWENSIENNKVSMSPCSVLSSGCYADWVAPVAKCSENWHFETVFSSKLACPDYAEEIPSSDTVSIDVDALLSYEYPYKEVSSLPTKVTVSELKASHDTVMTPMPAFLSDKEETGAFYGTAMHNFIKYVTLREDMSKEHLDRELEALTESGKISDKEAAKINTQKILDFFQSPLGKRILSSKKVCREQPFEVTLPAKLLFPDAENAESESIILQGIIDCYFEEDDQLVLVDYKTDYYTSPDEIHKKYDLQLSLYSLALEKITEKKVKNKFFYLFFDNSVL